VGVDTNRIGMIGFSAGAGLTMYSTLNSKTMDLAFIGPIYGGMGPVEVPEDAPPMFNVIATDDFLFGVNLGVIESCTKQAYLLNFIFTKTEVTVLAWEIPIEPVIVGLMPLYTG